MPPKKPTVRFLSSVAALGLITVSQSGAAILTNITTSGANTTSANLSSLGTTNWAVWNVRANGTTSSISATASKNGGLGTISGITFTGADATSVRGTDSLGNYPSNIFTWTAVDATGSTAAPSDGKIPGVFQSPLNFVGTGVKFSIQNLPPLAAGQYYLITVLGSGYQAINTLTATVGSDSVSQDSNSFGNSKTTDSFRFHYEPTSISDQIDFSYTIKTDTDAVQALSQAVIQGVTISVVPEPSSSVMALVGGLAFLGFRRRKG
jgi:PEP-CTERM putative exosortase interaction domain